MPRRTVDPAYVPLTLTCPAGTTAAAPLVTAAPTEHSFLERVQLQIPRGHNGATGIRFTLANQQILPWSNTVAWIQGDDYTADFELGIEIDRGLSVVTFNAGFHPHTFFMRFKVRTIDDNASGATLTLLANEDLTA